LRTEKFDITAGRAIAEGTQAPIALNKAYVTAVRKANGNVRRNFKSVSAYDGMHLIYAALKKTGGNSDGDALVAAMRGMSWEKPTRPDGD
jgi:branched-chain amino acid transport system substrate-binding protein